MTEAVKQTWNADHPYDGPFTITVIEERNLVPRIIGALKPRRRAEIPSAQVGGLLYEPVPIKLRANERVEIRENGELISEV